VASGGALQVDGGALRAEKTVETVAMAADAISTAAKVAAVPDGMMTRNDAGVQPARIRRRAAVRV